MDGVLEKLVDREEVKPIRMGYKGNDIILYLRQKPSAHAEYNLLEREGANPFTIHQ